MTEETAQKAEQAEHAPRSVSLSDEDRRLLAALLDELLGKTRDGHPTPQPQSAEQSSHGGGCVPDTVPG